MCDFIVICCGLNSRNEIFLEGFLAIPKLILIKETIIHARRYMHGDTCTVIHAQLYMYNMLFISRESFTDGSVEINKH